MNWTLEDVIEFVGACYDRDTILDVLMGYSAYWFPARMVLIVGRGWVQLFATASFELPANLPKESRRADVDDDAPAVSETLATGTADELGLGNLFDQLQLGAPLLRTLGIQIGNRVAIVLVGLVHDAATDTEPLERAAAVAGEQLEAVIRMAKADELPPPDERVPAFPTPRPARPPGAESARPDGRSTQRIQDLEVARDQYERELSTPRLRQVVPADESADGPGGGGADSTEVDANSTSFGLPFFKVPRPTPVEPEDDGGSEADENPQTEIGTPMARSMGAADELSEDSDPAILLDEPAGGVDVVAPLDISADAHSTQLGGLSAPSDLSEASVGTVVGRPMYDRDPSRTQIGGLGADVDLIDRSLQQPTRYTAPTPVAPKTPAEPPPAEPSPAEKRPASSSPAWAEPKSKGGVPSAMILKPARKRKRAPAETPAASAKTPDKDDDEPRAPDSPAPTPPADAALDDWIDAFAEEAKNFAADTQAALNFSLSEPSEEPGSIPPETLDRLLEAGPEIVDMQEEFILLDSRDRDRAYAAADRIAAMGDKAIDVLEAMFPGRIFLDRYKFGDELPPVDQHGPLLHALVRIGDRAVSVASSHLEDASNEARFYAVYLLTVFDAEPLLPRLYERLFDRDQQVRAVAATVALQYRASQSFRTHIGEPLRAVLEHDDDVHVTTAASLLAKLRDVDAVEALIDAMENARSPRVKIAVLHALSDITLHAWSAPFEWRQWWKNARHEKREDWLVAALDHASPEIREQAHAELARLPGLELNYHPDQPAKLRKRAQEELRSWFARKSG